MLRVYLPLLPLPVLAVIFAVAACSQSRSNEPATRLIPPAAAYAMPAAPEAKPAVAAAAVEPAPSAEDVKEFERVVPK